MRSATGTPIAPWEQSINYSERERAAFIVKNAYRSNAAETLDVDFDVLNDTGDLPEAIVELEQAI